MLKPDGGRRQDFVDNVYNFFTELRDAILFLWHGLWGVALSKFGVNSVALILMLRAAMYYASMHDPSTVSGPHPCNLDQVEFGHIIFHRSVRALFSELGDTIDPIFSTNVDTAFIANLTYHDTLLPGPLHGNTVAEFDKPSLLQSAHLEGQPAHGSLEARNAAAEAFRAAVDDFLALRHPTARAMTAELRAYERYLEHRLVPNTPSYSAHWYRDNRQLGAAFRLFEFAAAAGYPYANRTGAALGFATHQVLALLASRLEDLAERVREADAALARLRVADVVFVAETWDVRALAATTLKHRQEVVPRMGEAWLGHTKHLRRQAGLSTDLVDPKPVVGARRMAERAFPVQCGVDVSGRMLFAEDLAGVLRVAEPVVKKLVKARNRLGEKEMGQRDKCDQIALEYGSVAEFRKDKCDGFSCAVAAVALVPQP